VPFPFGLVEKKGSKTRALTSSLIPVPLSDTRSAMYSLMAPRVLLRVALIEVHVPGLHRQVAVARHGVPRVDRQVHKDLFRALPRRGSAPVSPCRPAAGMLAPASFPTTVP